MAANEEELASLYVKVRADVSELERELVNIKRKIDKESKENQTKLQFKAKFDTAIAKLRLSELQTLRTKLQKEFDKKVSLNVDAASLDRTRAKIASVDSHLVGLQSSGNKIPALFGKIGAAIGTAFVAQKLVRFGFEAVALAGKVEGVKRAFDNLNQPDLLDNLRRATKGTVSDFELMKVAMRAANFKIPLTELSTLLEFAQKRAQQTGQEVDYLVNSIIDGIGRKSTLVLDNLGISATELQTEFAKTGDFGKATANIIEREMQKAGGVIDTTADKVAQLNARLENQKAEIGKQLLPIWSGLLTILGGGLSVFSAMGQELKKLVTPQKYYNELLSKATQEQMKYVRMLENTYTSMSKLSNFITTTYKTQSADSIGKVKEKIDELVKAQDGLVYGSKEYLNNQKEIEKLEKSIGIGKDKTITTKFESQIPTGFTAQQVAEFEKLKFSVQGYVDFRIAQIENTYKQEIDKAKGSAVEIAKAEENKLLAYARFNQEMIDLQKEGSDATNKIVSDSLNEREKELEVDIEQEAQIEAEGYKKRQDALSNFYEQSKSYSEEYFKFRVNKIAEESAALLEATGDPLIAKQLEIEGMKALEQEYFNWKIEQWRRQAGIFAASLDGLAAGYDTFWQSLANSDITGAERIQQVWDAIKNAVLQSVGEIIKGYILNMIQAQVVGDALKAAELGKGIALGGSLAAAYAPAAAFASIMSFGGAAVAGSAGLASTVALAQVLAIPKFAKGGDFIVPPGFSNDTYPILVESGERVQVTPANQVGKQDSSFSELSRKLDILNKNLVDKNFSPVINADTYIDSRKLTKAVFKTANRMQKEGRDI